MNIPCFIFYEITDDVSLKPVPAIKIESAEKVLFIVIAKLLRGCGNLNL